ncbi:hypothetical protein [Pedobacter ureilyticus]|uniref:Uncharacterized protein n=1 Tax=Pedobacter ureilyticus TaxID=1393051 RepID=A0ABW9JC79_9SPHI|nr:hypothetical protein [Pedobacter helvus]
MDNETYKIKFDYSTLDKLKNIALKHLKVDNMNNLRDKFEGQSYLNAFLVKSFAELTLERFLGFSFIDENLKTLRKDYQPEIIVENKKLIIIAFKHDEVPKIRRIEFELAVFVSINLHNKTAEILGFLDYKSIVDNCSDYTISPLTSKIFIGSFSDFKLLKSVDLLKSN